MRVGLISYDFCCPYIGGMGMHVTELFKRINEVDDMEVIAISGRKNNFSNAFYVSTPNFQFLPEFFFFSFIVNCKINNWIKNYDLDLIHMHGGQGGVQLLRRVKVPLLYTVHHSYAQVYKFFPNRMYQTQKHGRV